MNLERAEAITRYREWVHRLGHTPDEVALLVIGFAAGWDELETGLTRILEAVKQA